MEGIVIGVDESASAACALRWGVAHAALHRRPATALLAWTFRDQHHTTAHPELDPKYGRPEASRDLDDIIERALGGPHPEVRRCIACGPAASELLAAGREADVVVVGARGTGGFPGLLLGSVSREVAFGARSPVAIVREAHADADGPIVVGVDGSDTSRGALRWAIVEARVGRRPVVAVWTWHRAAVGLGEPHAHMEAAARALERELAPCATAAPARIIEPRVVEGLPAAVLVEASRTASLVVVGSRGHRTATGLLLGSVSDQLAHHAECPVVIVPPSTLGAADRAGGAGR